MLRETFTTLQALCHKCTQTQSDGSTLDQDIKDELNRGYTDISAVLKDYKTQITKTTTCVVGQQFYHNPASVVSVESVVVTVGSIKINLDVLDSQKLWNEYNAIQFQGLVYPRYYFPRKDDFGIYATPQVAYPMTIVYNPRHKDMSAEDYTTGTVEVTNGSDEVQGSGTAWTSAMDNSFFKTSDGNWYRVMSVTSATTLILDNYYEGPSSVGLSYTIGESPELPEEVQPLLAYRYAEMFFMGQRGDANKATYWGNIYWTGDPLNSKRELTNVRGGLLGAINRYASRNDSGIVIRNPNRFDDWGNKVWGMTITQ